MFDSPSGRVSVQQEWNGSLIVIRAARDWTLIFFAIWLIGWTIMPLPIVVKGFRSLAHPGSIHIFDLLWSVGWLFGICFVVSQIAWGLGGKDAILLSPEELQLTSTVFGVAIRRKIAPTSDVRNLRFMPSYRSGRSRTPSRIAFEDRSGTVRFAPGLDDSEAFAVIEAMLAVYPFPKRDRALEYMALDH